VEPPAQARRRVGQLSAAGASGARLLCWPVAAALTLAVGAALTVALPQPARQSLVGAFAAGETLFAVGVVLIVVGIGIQMWRLPERPSTPRRSLFRLVDAVAGSGLALLGLAVNAAGAGLHPAAVLLSGRSANPDTRMLLADLGAVLLVYVPLALFLLGRRRAVRSARLAA
jgi:hypothetical protein